MNETAQTAQERAILTAREWCADPAAVIVDTETTALDGFVYDFAAVPTIHPAVYDLDADTDTATLPHWQTPAPVLAFRCAVPGDAVWSDVAAEMAGERRHQLPATSMSHHAAELFDLMQRRRVIAYNASFDQSRLLESLAEDIDVDAWEIPPFECLMRLYAPFFEQWSDKRGEWKSVSLEKACQMEGVDITDLPRHTAYGDAVAAARLLAKLAAKETASEREEREARE